MKLGEINFIPLDMWVYLIYPYFVTLEMHLFSRRVNKNVKQLTVLSDHCEQANKMNWIMLFCMQFKMLL